MNILWRNDCIFSRLDSFPFLSNMCLSTFVYISFLSDPSLIKLNYCKVSLPYVHAHLCMLCMHAYYNHHKICILMCHKVILITMPILIKILDAFKIEFELYYNPILLSPSWVEIGVELWFRSWSGVQNDLELKVDLNRSWSPDGSRNWSRNWGQFE